MADNTSRTSIEFDDACFEIALIRVTSLARSGKKSDSSGTEECFMDLYQIVREMSQSDDACGDSTDDVTDLIPNEDGTSAP